MYKALGIVLIVSGLGLTLLSLRNESNAIITAVSVDDMSLEDVLSQLGEKAYNHQIKNLDPAKVKIGEALIFKGKAKSLQGKRGKLISIHFVCTDCHSMSKENENPADLSSANRLAYAYTHQTSFLPGSTLWGVYNRTHWYNGDYVKKYGDLITNARDSLANAIQVCSKYCSSGRFLKDWELDAMLHYFKAHELKIKDLKLDESTKSALSKLPQLAENSKQKLKQTIQASYVQAYPATFLETMPRDQRKYGATGDARNGEKIYELSCLYCHQNKRVTYLNLDKSKLTANMFWKNREGYSDLSIYQIVRHGTFSKTGRKQYMPHFTQEKMSDDQLEDLMAYIRELAKK